MVVVKLYRDIYKTRIWGVQIACLLRMVVAYKKYYAERASENLKITCTSVQITKMNTNSYVSYFELKASIISRNSRRDVPDGAPLDLSRVSVVGTEDKVS